MGFAEKIAHSIPNLKEKASIASARELFFCGNAASLMVRGAVVRADRDRARRRKTYSRAASLIIPKSTFHR